MIFLELCNKVRGKVETKIMKAEESQPFQFTSNQGGTAFLIDKEINGYNLRQENFFNSHIDDG